MQGSVMNKGKTKYYNTACLMDEALIALLEKKDYEYITIKEICTKAGVNRSTFYLHYETMEDLLAECIEYIGSKIRDKFKSESVIDIDSIRTCPLEELILITPKYLIPYLQFTKDNRKVLMVATSQPATFKTTDIVNHLYDSVLEPIMKRFDISEKERRYKTTFYLNGIGSVIIEWIKNGCNEEVEEIANILISCLDLDNTSFA